ncbi:hypothetical protein [Lampropedia hyalina]|jgi:hypothetical protein|uniref:hypothetical protein n=1 Tax=Lampropedia hyalina TaxID=198706 RepID=UPI00116124B8|nr:hypothetical protein [Lampropedia hyalina]
MTGFLPYVWIKSIVKIDFWWSVVIRADDCDMHKKASHERMSWLARVWPWPVPAGDAGER